MTGPPPDSYPPYEGYEPPGGHPNYGPPGGGYTPPPPQNPYGGFPPPGGGYPGGGYPPPGYPPPGQQPQGYGGYPPQGPPGQYGQPIKPNNHLVWSIITIFLCLIPGIVATVYAAQVDGLWNQGRWPEATKASNNARTWAIIATVLGVLVILSYLGRAGSHAH